MHDRDIETSPLPTTEKIFIILASVFTGLLVIANIVAIKPVAIGSGVIIPAAVFAYALTFPITDCVSEIWGRKRANALVLGGFIASIIVAGMIRLVLWLPAASFWTLGEAFDQVLGANFRIVMASMAAYLVSQFHDVWAFSFWRNKTGGRHLWLRNNLSTFVSQFLDTTIFITLAFYGVWPDLLTVILGQFSIKILIALFDTPLVYLLVSWLRRIG